VIAEPADFWGLATEVAMTVTFPFAMAVTFAISLASASTTTIPSLELVNVTAREVDVGTPVTVAVKRTASPPVIRLGDARLHAKNLRPLELLGRYDERVVRHLSALDDRRRFTLALANAVPR
jgi:hypothetical protein